MLIKTGRELGQRNDAQHILQACATCGIERWVRIIRGIPTTKRCRPCGGGTCGRIVAGGYIFIRVYPQDPFYPMRISNGYVAEHRLVMAKHLGRLLEPEEVVHHDGTLFPMGSVEDKQDNRIENLILFPCNSAHLKYHGALKGGQGMTLKLK